jgi:hypothetical protein
MPGVLTIRNPMLSIPLSHSWFPANEKVSPELLPEVLSFADEFFAAVLVYDLW